MQINMSPAILNRVVKPARYTGQEWNAIKKDLNKVKVTYALAFPDVYEVGMSYLGFKIIYDILNRREDTAAERAYAPWVDMEQEMRKHKIPLYTLESFRPVGEFDMVGFTLQYEMSYSNILNMLNLAEIPLLASERTEEHPLIIAGGPGVYNAEPLANFIDLFLIGEGEQLIEELTDTVISWKENGKPGGRTGLLKQAAKLNGVYVPAFYNITYSQDGTIQAIVPNCSEAKPKIEKRVVCDFDAAPYPTKPIVPFTEIVHDRIMLEIFRGCTRGCRFCQAGILYRPVRERKPETLIRLAKEAVASTGYNEISLVSLSSADYSCLQPLIQGLLTEMQAEGVSVSLPSLRIDSFSIELAKSVQKVRKSGLTFAPEAGTQRLRDVINKGVTEQDLDEAVGAAFKAGWSSVKLYFMIGLPTETDEDIKGIADLAYHVLDLYKAIKGRRGVKVTVSVSTLVPKAQTAFQWFGQNTVEEIQRKQQLLKSFIKNRDISLHWHDAETSFLEGVFARGDRRLGTVLLEAWKRGARFDSWTEQFRYQAWMEAFAAAEIDPAFYANRERSFTETMPWEVVSPGIDKSFLINEYKHAIGEDFTKDCRRDLCNACGVCQSLDVDIVDWGKQA